jgi:hypothetical protein
MEQEMGLPALRHTFPRHRDVGQHVALDDHRLRAGGSHGGSSKQAGKTRANDHNFHGHRNHNGSWTKLENVCGSLRIRTVAWWWKTEQPRESL